MPSFLVSFHPKKTIRVASKVWIPKFVDGASLWLFFGFRMVNSPQLPSTHHQLWKTLHSDESQALYRRALVGSFPVVCLPPLTLAGKIRKGGASVRGERQETTGTPPVQNLLYVVSFIEDTQPQHINHQVSSDKDTIR